MALTTIQDIRLRRDGIFELVVERNGIDFQPGDCVALSNDKGVSRPYSIASGRDESELRCLIRHIPGGAVSAWLAARAPGDRIDISPPFGWFRPGRSGADGAPCVFLATGTGIGPFLSALRSDPSLAPSACWHGVRRLRDAVALDYLRGRCVSFRLSLSREDVPPHHHGRITDRLDALPHTPDTHYYLCGLDAMIDEVTTWLEQRGTSFTNIHREVFFNA